MKSLKYILYILEAVKRVWRNLRDEKKREENGKKEEHRKKNKMAKRTRDVIFLYSYNYIIINTD